MAQKLGIDSAVLRQELKHAAANRSTATLKAGIENMLKHYVPEVVEVRQSA